MGIANSVLKPIINPMLYEFDQQQVRDFRKKRTVALHAGVENSDEELMDLISKLPEAQRQVVQMAFYRGLSQREIARETGIPLGTIRTRLELGVKKLRALVCAMGTRKEWLAAA